MAEAARHLGVDKCGELPAREFVAAGERQAHQRFEIKIEAEFFDFRHRRAGADHAAEQCTNRCAHHQIGFNTDLAQGFEYANMREPARAAGTEHQRQARRFRPGDETRLLRFRQRCLGQQVATAKREGRTCCGTQRRQQRRTQKRPALHSKNRQNRWCKRLSGENSRTPLVRATPESITDPL